MPITITSKKHLFRRCGISHPAGPMDYPDGHFTAAELETLKAEPMLTVTMPEPEPAPAREPASTMEAEAAPEPQKRKKR